ncbi:MAG: hypothetical protein WBE97_08235 [Candidatus Acidiferrales bacterium]
MLDLLSKTISLRDLERDRRPMELQHVNVKLFAESAGEVDLAPLIPVFHQWIQDQVFDDLLLDIADYQHVPAGPGIVLIGFQGDYSVDNTGDRLGVRYNRKGVLDGSNQDRLAHSVRAALSAFARLEAEPRLEKKLRFGGREIEVFINDRLLAPNNGATRQAAEADIQALFLKLFRESAILSAGSDDPRRLFSVTARASHSFSLAELLANLNS